MINAVALYDFIGNEETDELSFKAGDIITILNSESGDGWWEGKLVDGSTGVFPELYVQILSFSHAENEDLESPSTECDSQQQPSFAKSFRDTSAFRDDRPPTPPPLPFSLPKPPKMAPPPKETQSAITKRTQSMFIPSQSEIEKPPTPPSPLPLGIRRSKSTVEIGGRHQSIVNDDGSIEIVDGPPSDKVKRLTIRRSFNRFSLFVNTGAESFLINNNSNSAENKSPVSGLFRSASLSLKKRQETEAAVEQAIKAEHVIENHPDNKWKADGAQSADISITGNLVKSKYAGTKKFVAYQIFDAVSNVIVYRRYKHFAWMHRIMQKTYPSLCLPPLPNRQVQGRFEQEFIDSRQHALERYLRRLAAHPVLCKSKVFTLFMQCTEPAQWKAGKRLAERDAAKGPNFLNTVSLPPTEDCDANPVTANDSAKTAKFARFCKSMQTHCLSLWDALNGIALAAPSMEHIYLRLAFSMKRLVRGNTRNDDGATTNAEGNWCWKEDCEDCAHLTSFIDQTFMAIRDMAIFWDSNAKKTCLPLLEQLGDYQPIIESMDMAVNLFQTTAQRANATNKTANSELTDPQDLNQFNERCAVILGVAKAEMNHFHDMRVKDFKDIFQSFISGQITFHEKMLEKLRAAQSGFE